VGVRPATRDDVARIGRTAARAFENDPVVRWLFPDDDYFQLAPTLDAQLAERWLVTASCWCTDDAVAFAGWQPPGRPEIDVAPPRVEHPRWRLERMAAVHESMAEHSPPERHWYLNMLGTHPDWQRQGFGATVMAPGIAAADEAGLPCYLETATTANVAYYRHHGFEVASEWDLPLDGPHMWGMLRPPR
jgi:ribosomal protein S18 acetylase RimI-like enzyme